jgi:hypothetical protein
MAQPGSSAEPATLAEAVNENALPRALPDLLGELSRRAAEVERLVKDGDLGQVWLPAMATKTAALALEPHVGTLPPPQRVLAESAAKRVVVSAWQLDKYGDLGNKPKMTAAYHDLATAVADLRDVYGSP